MINLPLMDFPQVETEQAGLSILKQNGAINLLELNITSQMLIKMRCSSKKNGLWITTKETTKLWFLSNFGRNIL